MSRSKVVVVPLTLPKANRVVSAIHRHHPPIPAGFDWFSVGAVADRVLCGVAIAGRPTNRNNDDTQTVEVLRVATDGTPNACSALLGACARAARAIGAARILTYTLEKETGASLRGAGWVLESDGIMSWWTTSTPGRTPGVHREHSDKSKARWALDLREPVTYVDPWDGYTDDQQETLDFGGSL